MFGQPLQHLAETGSTNQIALEWADAPHGAAVLADSQTAGRGRLGRTWNSPPGRGLYLSIILRPESEVSIPLLSLAAALAGARALEAAGAPHILCKWPNDLLVQQSNGHLAKIGGILCESRQDGAGRRVVIGIGINLNHREADLPERPQFPATSLWLLTNLDWNVENVLPRLFAEMESVTNQLTAEGWEPLRPQFNQRCAGVGEVVQVHNGDVKLLGVVQEVDTQGRLILRTADGPVAVIAGDVSYL